MNMRNVTLVLCSVLSVAICSESHAFNMPSSLPLSQTIARAQLTVVARIVKYNPDDEQGIKQVTKLKVGPAALIAATCLKPSGTYELRVLQTLKGRPQEAIHLALPAVSSIYYNHAPLRIEEGKIALFLLKSNVQGDWEAVDPTVPLLLLEDTASSTKHEDLAEPEARILDLLLASLHDPVLRQAHSYMLRQTVGARIIVGLAPYIDDPNPSVKDYILYALAMNQQVIVIPRIARLEATLAQEEHTVGSSAASLTALRFFTTQDAIPYLNPLLFHTSEYARLNAMLALQHLCDRNSIPYFLLAMRDPDPQKVVAPGACALLHKLVPALGVAKDEEFFYSHHVQSILLPYRWWRDELSGKHLSSQSGEPAAPAPKSMPELDNATPQQAVPLLNPLLFENALDTRRQAIAALEKLADHSSIPYLLLATEDPDTTVAYSAYKTLSRLMDGLSDPIAPSKFRTQHEVAVKPLYQWWNDELVGLHSEEAGVLSALLDYDEGVAYKAYKRLHQLNPVLGPVKDESIFLAHRKDEVLALHRWRMVEWQKAHPTPTGPARQPSPPIAASATP